MIYEKNLAVQFGDVDIHNHLTMKGALRLMQEACNCHSAEAGSGVNDIETTGYSWMLHQQRLRLRPERKKSLRCTTPITARRESKTRERNAGQARPVPSRPVRQRLDRESLRRRDRGDLPRHRARHVPGLPVLEDLPQPRARPVRQRPDRQSRQRRARLRPVRRQAHRERRPVRSSL